MKKIGQIITRQSSTMPMMITTTTLPKSESTEHHRHTILTTTVMDYPMGDHPKANAISAKEGQMSSTTHVVAETTTT
jgi:hypothetical protein